MTKFHRNHVALIVAVFVAMLVGLPSLFVSKPDVLVRMALAASLYLLSQDVLAGAAISKGERKVSNPDRWVQSFYLALNIGIYLMLALWQGGSSFAYFMPRILVAAVIVGLLLGLLANGPEYRFKKHFVIEQPLGKIFYIWPIFVMLLVPLQMYLIPNLTVTTLFLFPIGFGFLLPRYKRAPDGSLLWTNLPRLTGFALLALLTIIDIIFAG